MAAPTQIKVSQLSRLIGLPDAPIIVDVCIDEDYALNPRLIPASFRHPVDEFSLNIPALRHLATIVRAADTNRLELAPEAAGLLAASLGLSRMYRDDLAQLDAGMSLYDAFYRWARDATDEGHDWPTSSSLCAKSASSTSKAQ